MMRFTLVGSSALLLAISVPLPAHEMATKSSQSGALSTTARAAAAVVDAFHAAITRGDTQAAAALLTDDALVFESGSAERSKAEYAAHHLGEDAAFSQVVRETVTRRTGSAIGNLAWIASEGRMTGTYKGKALDRLTTETMVLRHTPGGWKIVHIHWSSGAKQ